MKKETNHDKFVKAFKGMEGRTLETKEIKRILKSKTNIEEGSILPNDHASGNKCPCSCAATENRVFDRIKRGFYKVR